MAIFQNKAVPIEKYLELSKGGIPDIFHFSDKEFMSYFGMKLNRERQTKVVG